MQNASAHFVEVRYICSSPYAAIFKMKNGPDLEHSGMPDTIGESVISLMARVEALEQLA
jgi:hypothetical protein